MMNRRESLVCEKTILEKNLEILDKEYLILFKEKKMLEKQIQSLNNEENLIRKLISEKSKNLDTKLNEYLTKYEKKLFLKIILLNLIPFLSLSALIIISGNAHFFHNIGLYSLFFTGVPTMLLSSGICMLDLKDIRNKNKKIFFNTSEYDLLDKEIKKLEANKYEILDEIYKLKIDLNALVSLINQKDMNMYIIKNRIYYIDFVLRRLISQEVINIEQNNRLIK